MVKVLRSDRLTTGPKVDEFEERLAGYGAAAKGSTLFNTLALGERSWTL